MLQRKIQDHKQVGAKGRQNRLVLERQHDVAERQVSVVPCCCCCCGVGLTAHHCCERGNLSRWLPKNRLVRPAELRLRELAVSSHQ